MTGGLILCIAVAMLTVYPISDPDFWLHLKSGEVMVSQGKILTTDVFSHTKNGQPWLNHQWASQIIFYLLHNWGGFYLLNLFKLSLLIATALLLYLTGLRMGASPPGAAFFIAFVFHYSRIFMDLRPYLFTYLFISIYLFVLSSTILKIPSNSIYLLPILTILWVNLHGGHIIGLFIQGSWCISFAIASIIDQQKRKSIFRKGFITMAIIFVISLFCSLVNPFSYKALLFPFKFTAGKLVLSVIYEWLPTWGFKLWDAYFMQLLGFFILALGLLIYLVARFGLNGPERLRQINYLLLFIALAYPFWRSQRMVVIFGLCLCPFVCVAASIVMDQIFALLGRERGERYARKSQWSVSIILMIIIASFAAKPFIEHLEENGILGITTQVPKQGIEFLRANNLKPLIFNSYEFGGYLLYNLYPEIKVFIDGRVMFYGEEMLADYLESSNGVRGIYYLLTKYDIECFFLKYPKSEASGEIGIHRGIVESARFALVYFDDRCLIYLRRQEPYHEIIDRFEYRYLNPLVINLAAVNKQNVHLYMEELERAFEHDNESYVYLNFMGIFSGVLDRPHQSLKYFKHAVELYPEIADLYFNLAMTYEILGELFTAIDIFQKGLELKPDRVDILYHLVNLLIRTGKLDLAREYAVQLLKYSSDKEQAKRMIQGIEGMMSDMRP